MSQYENGWQGVMDRLEGATAAQGREPGSVALVAVSKSFPAGAVRVVHGLGQRAFGENYAQEALRKMDALGDLPDLEWHFIGPLQANKTRAVAERFAWVHTVDRLRIAERLAAARPAGAPPLCVCIQVNISGEASRRGVTPEEALVLAPAVAALRGLVLRGFMGMAAPGAELPEQRRQFRILHDCLDRCRGRGLALDTLSMGMSGDLEAAIAEGATVVRVGSAIFGARPQQ